MFITLTDMDGDTVIIDSEVVDVVTEAYTYDDSGNRIKNGSRFVHLHESGRIEVKDSLIDILTKLNDD